jgi:hypothetical protein
VRARAGPLAVKAALKSIAGRLSPANLSPTRDPSSTTEIIVQTAIITTTAHNVGDDFVREGILYLLHQVTSGVRVELIHKHLPLTARPEWDWMRHSAFARALDRLPRVSSVGVAERIDSLLPLRRGTDRVLTSQLLIQSGAPVYWLHGKESCAQNEWYGPLIRRRWQRVRSTVPFLSLAGGSCQAYDSDGSEFGQSAETLAYIREFYDACRLTTVRDLLSERVLKLAGRSAPVLPCTSIFARLGLGIEPAEPRYVVLNYMPGGGHFSYGGQSHARAWEQTFADFVRQLPRDAEYRMLCHSRAELAEARRLFGHIHAFWSEDYREYLQFMAHARFGIVNRVHAGFALASFGRPCFVVGSDSRTRMCGLIGLRHEHVGAVHAAGLLSELELLREQACSYPAVMRQLQEDSGARYVGLLRGALV